MRYSDYLKSPQWKALAKAARVRARNRCEHCGRQADHVHHVKYPKNRDYSGDCLNNLLVVCASCHAKHHGIRGREMSNAMTVEFEGDAICTTVEDGVAWGRYVDIAKVLALVVLPWGESHKAELIEGEDWRLMLNPFTNQLEPFLSPQGVLILGMRFGTNNKARALRRKLAEMGTGGALAQSGHSVGAALVAQANAIYAMERRIDAQDAKIEKEVQLREAMRSEFIDQMRDLRQTIDDFMRTADWLRRTGKAADEAHFGMFLATLAKSRGGRKTPEGWFSHRGEQLSRSLPAPDTRFAVINKWRITYMEWAWERYRATHGSN